MSELFKVLGLLEGETLASDLIGALEGTPINDTDVTGTLCEELLDLFAAEDDGLAMACEACMVRLAHQDNAQLVMDTAADRLLLTPSVRVAHACARIMAQLLSMAASEHVTLDEGVSYACCMLQAAASAEQQAAADFFMHVTPAAMAARYYARTLSALILGHISMWLGERVSEAAGTEAGALLRASLEVACASPLQADTDGNIHTALGALSRMLACLYPELRPTLAARSLKVMCDFALWPVAPLPEGWDQLCLSLCAAQGAAPCATLVDLITEHAHDMRLAGAAVKAAALCAGSGPVLSGALLQAGVLTAALTACQEVEEEEGVAFSAECDKLLQQLANSHMGAAATSTAQGTPTGSSLSALLTLLDPEALSMQLGQSAAIEAAVQLLTAARHLLVHKADSLACLAQVAAGCSEQAAGAASVVGELPPADWKLDLTPDMAAVVVHAVGRVQRFLVGVSQQAVDPDPEELRLLRTVRAHADWLLGTLCAGQHHTFDQAWLKSTPWLSVVQAVLSSCEMPQVQTQVLKALQRSLAVVMPAPVVPRTASGNAPASQQQQQQPLAPAAEVTQLVRTLLHCAGSTHRPVAGAAALCLGSLHVLWLAQGSGRASEQPLLHLPKMLGIMPALLLRRAVHGFLVCLADCTSSGDTSKSHHMALWAFLGRASDFKPPALIKTAAAGEKAPVTASMARSGLKVVRGPDWSWGEQDGGEGKIGTMLNSLSSRNAWWEVKWSTNGNINSYRVGGNGKHDLCLAAEQDEVMAPLAPTVEDVEPLLSSLSQKTACSGLLDLVLESAVLREALLTYQSRLFSHTAPEGDQESQLKEEGKLPDVLQVLAALLAGSATQIEDAVGERIRAPVPTSQADMICRLDTLHVWDNQGATINEGQTICLVCLEERSATFLKCKNCKAVVCQFCKEAMSGSTARLPRTRLSAVNDFCAAFLALRGQGQQVLSQQVLPKGWCSNLEFLGHLVVLTELAFKCGELLRCAAKGQSNSRSYDKRAAPFQGVRCAGAVRVLLETGSRLVDGEPLLLSTEALRMCIGVAHQLVTVVPPSAAQVLDIPQAVMDACALEAACQQADVLKAQLLDGRHSSQADAARDEAARGLTVQASVCGILRHLARLGDAVAAGGTDGTAGSSITGAAAPSFAFSQLKLPPALWTSAPASAVNSLVPVSQWVLGKDRQQPHVRIQLVPTARTSLDGQQQALGDRREPEGGGMSMEEVDTPVQSTSAERLAPQGTMASAPAAWPPSSALSTPPLGTIPTQTIPSGAPVFGTSPTNLPVFGMSHAASGPIFGGSPAAAVPVFGASPGGQPVFGTPPSGTPPYSAPTFGSGVPAVPVFVASSAASGPVFGAPAAASSLLSGTLPAAPPAFGAASTSGSAAGVGVPDSQAATFAVPAADRTSGDSASMSGVAAAGAASATSEGVGSSASAAPPPVAGTAQPFSAQVGFRPVEDRDEHHVASASNMRLQSIAAMPEYAGLSPEEVRLRDVATLRGHASSTPYVPAPAAAADPTDVTGSSSSSSAAAAAASATTDPALPSTSNSSSSNPAPVFGAPVFTAPAHVGTPPRMGTHTGSGKRIKARRGVAAGAGGKGTDTPPQRSSASGAAGGSAPQAPTEQVSRPSASAPTSEQPLSKRLTQVEVVLLDMLGSSSSAVVAAGARALVARLSALVKPQSEMAQPVTGALSHKDAQREAAARQKQQQALQGFMQQEDALSKVMRRLDTLNRKQGEEQQNVQADAHQLVAPLLGVAASLLKLATAAAPQQLLHVLPLHMGPLVLRALQLLVASTAVEAPAAAEGNPNTNIALATLSAAHAACLCASAQDMAWAVPVGALGKWLPSAADALRQCSSQMNRTSIPRAASAHPVDDSSSMLLQATTALCKLLRHLVTLPGGFELAGPAREVLGAQLAGIVCSHLSVIGAGLASAQVGVAEASLHTACLKLLVALYHPRPAAGASQERAQTAEDAPPTSQHRVQLAQQLAPQGIDLQQLLRAVLRLAASSGATRRQACDALEAMLWLCGQHDMGAPGAEVSDAMAHASSMLPDGVREVLLEPATCLQLLRLMGRVQAASGSGDGEDEDEEVLAALQVRMAADGGEPVTRASGTGNAEVAYAGSSEPGAGSSSSNASAKLMGQLGLLCPYNPRHPLKRQSVLGGLSTCNACGCRTLRKHLLCCVDCVFDLCEDCEALWTAPAVEWKTFTAAVPSGGMRVLEAPHPSSNQIASLTTGNTPVKLVNRTIVQKLKNSSEPPRAIYQKVHPDHYPQLDGTHKFAEHDPCLHGWVRVKGDGQVYLQPAEGLESTIVYGRTARQWNSQLCHPSLHLSRRTLTLTTDTPEGGSAAAKLNVAVREATTSYELRLQVHATGLESVRVGLMRASSVVGGQDPADVFYSVSPHDAAGAAGSSGCEVRMDVSWTGSRARIITWHVNNQLARTSQDIHDDDAYGEATLLPFVSLSKKGDAVRLLSFSCPPLLGLVIKHNSHGDVAYRGVRVGHTVGGITGQSSYELYYCGKRHGQCRCGGCDGRCGPDNGCPCTACAELAGLCLRGTYPQDVSVSNIVFGVCGASLVDPDAPRDGLEGQPVEPWTSPDTAGSSSGMQDEAGVGTRGRGRAATTGPDAAVTEAAVRAAARVRAQAAVLALLKVALSGPLRVRPAGIQGSATSAAQHVLPDAASDQMALVEQLQGRQVVGALEQVLLEACSLMATDAKTVAALSHATRLALMCLHVILAASRLCDVYAPATGTAGVITPSLLQALGPALATVATVAAGRCATSTEGLLDHATEDERNAAKGGRAAAAQLALQLLQAASHSNAVSDGAGVGADPDLWDMTGAVLQSMATRPGGAWALHALRCSVQPLLGGIPCEQLGQPTGDVPSGWERELLAALCAGEAASAMRLHALQEEEVAAAMALTHALAALCTCPAPGLERELRQVGLQLVHRLMQLVQQPSAALVLGVPPVAAAGGAPAEAAHAPDQCRLEGLAVPSAADAVGTDNVGASDCANDGHGLKQGDQNEVSDMTAEDKAVWDALMLQVQGAAVLALLHVEHVLPGCITAGLHAVEVTAPEGSLLTRGRHDLRAALTAPLAALLEAVREPPPLLLSQVTAAGHRGGCQLPVMGVIPGAQLDDSLLALMLRPQALWPLPAPWLSVSHVAQLVVRVWEAQMPEAPSSTQQTTAVSVSAGTDGTRPTGVLAVVPVQAQLTTASPSPAAVVLSSPEGATLAKHLIQSLSSGLLYPGEQPVAACVLHALWALLGSSTDAVSVLGLLEPQLKTLLKNTVAGDILIQIDSNTMRSLAHLHTLLCVYSSDLASIKAAVAAVLDRSKAVQGKLELGALQGIVDSGLLAHWGGCAEELGNLSDIVKQLGSQAVATGPGRVPEATAAWRQLLGLLEQLARNGKSDYLERLCIPSGLLSILVPKLFTYMDGDAGGSVREVLLELQAQLLTFLEAVVLRVPTMFADLSGTAPQHQEQRMYQQLVVVAKACSQLLTKLLTVQAVPAGAAAGASTSYVWPPEHVVRCCRLLYGLLGTEGVAGCVDPAIRERLLTDSASGLEELRSNMLGARIKDSGSLLSDLPPQRTLGTAAGLTTSTRAAAQPHLEAGPLHAGTQIYAQCMAMYAALARAGNATLQGAGATLEEVTKLPLALGHHLGPALLPALRLMELVVGRGADAPRSAVKRAAPRLTRQLLQLVAEPQRLCELDPDQGSNKSPAAPYDTAADANMVAIYTASASLLCKIMAPATAGGLGAYLHPTCMPLLVALLQSAAVPSTAKPPRARAAAAGAAAAAAIAAEGGDEAGGASQHTTSIASIPAPEGASGSGAVAAAGTGVRAGTDEAAGQGRSAPLSEVSWAMPPISQEQVQLRQQAVIQVLDTLVHVIHAPMRASLTGGTGADSPGANATPAPALVGAGVVPPLIMLLQHVCPHVARSAAEVLVALASNPVGCHALHAAAAAVVCAVGSGLVCMPAQRVVASIHAGNGLRSRTSESGKATFLQQPAAVHSADDTAQQRTAAAGAAAAAQALATAQAGYLTTADLALLLVKRPVLADALPCAPARIMSDGSSSLTSATGVAPGSTRHPPAAASAAAPQHHIAAWSVAATPEAVPVVGEADNTAKSLLAAATTGTPVSEVELEEVARERTSNCGVYSFSPSVHVHRPVRLALRCEHDAALHCAFLQLLSTLLVAPGGKEALGPFVTGNMALLQATVLLLKSLSDRLPPARATSVVGAGPGGSAGGAGSSGGTRHASVYLPGCLHDTALMALDLVAAISASSIEDEMEAAAAFEAAATKPAPGAPLPLATPSPIATALTAANATEVLCNLLSHDQPSQGDGLTTRKALVTRAAQVLSELASIVPGFATAVAARTVRYQDDVLVRACVGVLRDAQPVGTRHKQVVPGPRGTTTAAAAAPASAFAMPLPSQVPTQQHVLRGALRVLLRVCRTDGGLALTAVEAGALMAAMWLSTWSPAAAASDSAISDVGGLARDLIGSLVQIWKADAGWVHTLCSRSSTAPALGTWRAGFGTGAVGADVDGGAAPGLLGGPPMSPVVRGPTPLGAATGGLTGGSANGILSELGPPVPGAPPALFRCLISGACPIKDPVLLPDGYTYERSAAEAYVLGGGRVSPKTGQEFQWVGGTGAGALQALVVENKVLKMMMSEWAEGARGARMGAGSSRPSGRT